MTLTILRKRGMLAVTFAAVLAMASCSLQNNPTAPVSTDIKLRIGLAVAGGIGTYSATFNGQTYTSRDGFDVSLKPGTYTVSGTYNGGALIVVFVGDSNGSVQTSSVSATSGIVSVVTPCSIVFSEGSGTRSFGVRFTVTRDVRHTC